MVALKTLDVMDEISRGQANDSSPIAQVSRADNYLSQVSMKAPIELQKP
jgi:hypothetical protein